MKWFIYVGGALGLVALGAYGYRRATQSDKPREYDKADQELLRQDAVHQASQIDDEQIAQEAHADAQRRAHEQARHDAQLAAARQRDADQLAQSGAQPMPEIIKRPDGTIGYWKGGRFYRLPVGLLVLAPSGVYGTFDASGGFVPAADQAQAAAQVTAAAAEVSAAAPADASGSPPPPAPAAAPPAAPPAVPSSGSPPGQDDYQTATPTHWYDGLVKHAMG